VPVSLFLKSPVVDWIVSCVGVAMFLGLTAYDTQVIRSWSAEAGDSLSEADYIRFSILGALKLYLDLINLFLFFLRIFGRRKQASAGGRYLPPAANRPGDRVRQPQQAEDHHPHQLESCEVTR
jgi:hypothetical protein